MRDFQIGNHDRACRGFPFIERSINRAGGNYRGEGENCCITDEKKGALRTMSDREGYETFIIPDNVGGRYSVLTPVGLLPVAMPVLMFGL